MDIITGEMLKYGETLVELMVMICDLTWRQREVPDEWKSIIVPLHKVSKDECNDYRGMTLLTVLGKVCGCLDSCFLFLFYCFELITPIG